MSPLTFFATTGAVTWAYLSWRVVRYIRNIPMRARSWLTRRRMEAYQRSRPYPWNHSPQRPNGASWPAASSWGARRPARVGPYRSFNR